MLIDIVKTYLIESANVNVSVFDKPDLRVQDLGLDSLGLVEMLFEVEDKFGFQIEDPMRYADMGFVDMVADMESAIRAKNNGQMPTLV